MDSLKYIKCNLCGSDDYDIFHTPLSTKLYKKREKSYSSKRNKKLTFQVVKCKNCGLIFLNPRPIKNSIIKSYSRLDKYGYCLEGEFSLMSQKKCREYTFKRYIKIIEKYLKKNAKLLDIGAAVGSFLYVAKQKRWEVFGIEPNKQLCRWAKENYGVKIRCGTLFEHHFPNQSFDIVTLWDTLEHVCNPKKLLKECNRILKKDGILVISYPNIGSLPAVLLGRKWIFFISDHLYYFNSKTIEKMLNRTGFKRILQRRFFQFVYLDYLFFKAKRYSSTISFFGERIIKFFGISKIKVPYWLGQSFIVCKNSDMSGILGK